MFSLTEESYLHTGTSACLMHTSIVCVLLAESDFGRGKLSGKSQSEDSRDVLCVIVIFAKGAASPEFPSSASLPV